MTNFHCAEAFEKSHCFIAEAKALPKAPPREDMAQLDVENVKAKVGWAGVHLVRGEDAIESQEELVRGCKMVCLLLSSCLW